LPGAGFFPGFALCGKHVTFLQTARCAILVGEIAGDSLAANAATGVK